jgi:ParB-like chromosome segregation protein Spo0J
MRTVNHEKLFSNIKIGFETEMITLKLEDISPLKIVTAVMRDSEKFQQIVASIREVGIIEAPVVAAPRRGQGKYMLLDGHLRIEALREIEIQEVTCLVSTDDESFTYNKHISRLSPIQEHRMIVQAIKRGVSEEKMARALNLNVTNIISKRDLLNGIALEQHALIHHIHARLQRLLRQLHTLWQFRLLGNFDDPLSLGL